VLLGLARRNTDLDLWRAHQSGQLSQDELIANAMDRGVGLDKARHLLAAGLDVKDIQGQEELYQQLIHWGCW